MAWGDVDGDGDLDLFVGNNGTPVGSDRLYLNQDGKLAEAPPEIFDDKYKDITTSVAWGDVDGDGDLDLFVGNVGSDRLYLNQDDKLAEAPEGIFTDSDADDTYSVAWGDVDGDGDLDLFVGNIDQPNRLYLNQGGRLAPAQEAVFTDLYAGHTRSVAWGDVDGDGDLDLYAGNAGITYGSDRLYLNRQPAAAPYGTGIVAAASRMHSDAIRTSANLTTTFLAPAAFYAVDSVRDGIIPISYTLLHPDAQPVRVMTGTYSLNGGGDHDWTTAVPTIPMLSDLSTLAHQVYGSHAERLLDDFATVSATLVVTRAQPIVDLDVWLNLTHTLASDLEIALVSPAGQTIQLIAATQSVTGYVETLLDDQAAVSLHAGRAPFTGRYRPAGRLADLDGESSKGSWTLRIADRRSGNSGALLGWALHFNRTTPTEYTGTLSSPRRGTVATAVITVPTASPVTDVDVLLNISRTLEQPVVELVPPRGRTVMLVEIQGRTQFTSTRLSDQAVNLLQDSEPPHTGIFRPVSPLAALDGENPQGPWTLRVKGATADASAAAIGNWTLLLQTADGGQHVYYWDVNRSGFFGQSDNVVFRLAAYPGLTPTRNGTPGPFERPFVATQTYPFRVRGNQVQVFSDTVSSSNTVTDAVVYRFPASTESGALPLGGRDAPYRTAKTGFLQGRAPMVVSANELESDRLVAVLPTAEVTDSVPALTFLSQDSFPITVTNGTPVRSHLVISDARGIGDIGLWVEISHALSQSTLITLTAPRHGPTELDVEKLFPSGQRNVIFESAPESVVAVCPQDSVTACHVDVQGLTDLHGTLADGTWTLEISNPTAEPVELLRWGLILQLSPLHFTSAAPTPFGLEPYTVTSGGVQTLVVSTSNPLLLFDLNVALEWDANLDEHYRAQLSADLHRASELLYDWTNGQVALGNVRIYHDARRNPLPDGTFAWNNAHIRIYATNRLRPNADQGGYVSRDITETVKISDSVKEIVYLPGQVRMGSTWNRLGDATTGNLGDDWPAALAHELGHYLLFLDDNYLTSENNLLIPLSEEECPSAMNNPYSNAYSELQPVQSWLKSNLNCTKTLSHQNTGRSDWATIVHFYSWLSAPNQEFEAQNLGPSLLPLAVTQVSHITSTATTTTPLVVPIFYLKKGEKREPYRAGSQARAVLFQGPPSPSLVDFGQPINDQVVALGARRGDRLCVFDAGENRAGCKDIVPGDDQVPLWTAAGWEPQIVVTPETTQTLTIRLELPFTATNQLPLTATHQLPLTATNQVLTPLVRLFPANAPARQPAPMSLSEVTSDTVTFTATISTGEATLEGYVWVWAPDPPATPADQLSEPEPVVNTLDDYKGARQAITDFAIGGNPLRIRTLRAALDARDVRIRGTGVRIRGTGAPVASTDGQVIVYPDEDETGLDPNTEWSFTLQPASRLPSPIEYAKQIGRGYWLAASQGIGDFGQSSITFEYLNSDVPPGEKPFIHMYRWDDQGRRWIRLAEQTNYQAHNLISARLEGPGLYALFSHIDIPLEPGWNLIGYPVQGTRAISEALVSIDGKYSMVFGLDGDTSGDAWRVYIPGAGAAVNDLDALQFGRSYWIQITAAPPFADDLVLRLKGSAELTETLPLTYVPAAMASAPAPAVYYGAVRRSDGAEPALAPDSRVLALIGGQVCGEGEIDDFGNYAVKVLAFSPAAPGCGIPDREVVFKVGADAVAVAAWDNQAPHQRDLWVPAAPP